MHMGDTAEYSYMGNNASPNSKRQSKPVRTPETPFVLKSSQYRTMEQAVMADCAAQRQ